MAKLLLTSVAVFAMVTSAAFAQSTSSDTTTSTQSTTTTIVPPPAPVLESYSTNKTQKTIESNGTETDKSQSYTNGVNGNSASSTTRTTAPDGSTLRSTHDERNASPRGDTTTTHTTTTTTGQ
jgi:hypothetical protein